MSEHHDSLPSCPTEVTLLRAAGRGRWTDQLRDHLASCETCAEAVLLHEVLGELAAADLRRPAGDGTMVYRRAERLARQQAVQRATRAIVLWQRLATIVSAVAAAVSVGWLWPAGRGLADRFGPLLPSLPPAAAVDQSPLLLVGSTILFVAAAGLYLAWTED